MKAIRLSNLLTIILLLCSCNNYSHKNVNNSNEDKYLTDDIYTSIVEIKIREEFLSKERLITPNDFPGTNFKYIANFRKFVTYSKGIMVGVINNPSRENVFKTIDSVSKFDFVESASVIKMPERDLFFPEQTLDASYIRLFDKPLKESEYGICLGTKFYQVTDDNYFVYDKNDFPEIYFYDEYEGTLNFIPGENSVVQQIFSLRLKDDSIENTIDSFLALRNNACLCSVSYMHNGGWAE